MTLCGKRLFTLACNRPRIFADKNGQKMGPGFCRVLFSWIFLTVVERRFCRGFLRKAVFA